MLKTIPSKVMHICDVCGKEVEGVNHSRPYMWSEMKIFRDAYDHLGNAVAKGDYHAYFCNTCSVLINGAVNDTINRIMNKGVSKEE